MSFKYHRGGWCGPGYSDGKYQKSVRGYYTAVDEFDQTCKEHDGAYYDRRGIKAADYEFFRKNIGKGVKRSAAAIAIGTQGLLRKNDANNLSSSNNMANGYRTPKRVSIASVLNTAKRRAVGGRRVLSRGKIRQPVFGRKKTNNYMTGASIMPGGKVGFKKRSTRKFAKSRRGKLIRDGVSVTGEYGDIQSSSSIQQIVTLGHTSFNLALMQRCFAGALFKKLLYQAGAVVQGWDDPIPISAQTGLGFLGAIDIIFYFTNTATNPTQVIQTETLGGLSPTITLEVLVSWFCDTTRAWFPKFAVPTAGSPTQAAQVNFIKVALVCRTGMPLVDAAANVSFFVSPTCLWLERGKFSYETKSSLKFQNRSSGTVTESDAVDNIPLYGKFYEGFGNGIQPKSSQISANRVSLFGNTLSGVINPQPVVMNNAGFKEPPQPSLLPCKKYGKVTFSPGFVKTSVLTDKKSIGFNALYHIIFENWTLNSLAPTVDYYRLGNWRLFIVEKILQAGGSDSANMVLAYECNYDIYMCMSGGRKVASISKFISGAP